MESKIVTKERKKNFELKRFELFCYRTRYFRDAELLGSKEFVKEIFKHTNICFHQRINASSPHWLVRSVPIP
jgi:hypothetical protein